MQINFRKNAEIELYQCSAIIYIICGDCYYGAWLLNGDDLVVPYSEAKEDCWLKEDNTLCVGSGGNYSIELIRGYYSNRKINRVEHPHVFEAARRFLISRGFVV